MLTFFGFGRQIADEPLLVRGTPSNNLTKPNIFYPFTESWQAMEDALEIHAYYSKMFEAFARLPIRDIKIALDADDWKYLNDGDYHGLCKHYTRLSAYLSNSLAAQDRGQAVQEHIAFHQPIYQYQFERPEHRLPHARNRNELRRRFYILLHPGSEDAALAWAWGLCGLHMSMEEVEQSSILTAEEKGLLPLARVRTELIRTEVLADYKRANDNRQCEQEEGQWKKEQQVEQALKAGHKGLLPFLQATIDYSRGEEFVCYNFLDESDIPSKLIKNPDLFEPWLNNAGKPELKTYRRKLASILEIDVQRMDTLKSSFESGAYSLSALQSEFAGVEIVLPTLGQWISPTHNSVAPTFWEGLKDGLLRVQAESEVRFNLVSEKLGKPLFTRIEKTVFSANPEPSRRLALTAGRWGTSEPKTAEEVLARSPYPEEALAQIVSKSDTYNAGGKSPNQLTVDELALLCIYTRLSITRENAKDYLEGDLKSGDALYNKCMHYSKLSNRIGFADETAKKRGNMIVRIQRVLPRLTGEQKKGPEDEIVVLEGQNQ